MRQRIRRLVNVHPAEPIRTLGFIVGGYGPALAALVVVWVGSDSVRVWARQIVDWRVAPRWYVAAVTIPLVLIALTSVGLELVGTSVDLGLLSDRVSLVLVSFVSIALVGGGNEEPGWQVLHIGSTQSDPQFREIRLIAVLVAYPIVVWALGITGVRLYCWQRSIEQWLTPRTIAGLGVAAGIYVVTVIGAAIVLFIAALFFALPT